MRGSGQFLDMAPPLTGQDTRTGTRLRWLTGVQSEGACAEQGLPGPAGGEMNPDRPSGLPDAGADWNSRARSVSICVERHSSGSASWRNRLTSL